MRTDQTPSLERQRFDSAKRFRRQRWMLNGEDYRSLKPAPGFMLEVLFDEELDPADTQRLSTIVWSKPWLDGPYGHPAEADSDEFKPGDPGERELEFGRALLSSEIVGVSFHVLPQERICSLAAHAY